MNTVTEQLTDSSVREFVINGLLLETDYNVEVRGYYQLLGPPGTTTVRIESIHYNCMNNIEYIEHHISAS